MEIWPKMSTSNTFNQFGKSHGFSWIFFIFLIVYIITPGDDFRLTSNEIKNSKKKKSNHVKTAHSFNMLKLCAQFTNNPFIRLTADKMKTQTKNVWKHQTSNINHQKSNIKSTHQEIIQQCQEMNKFCCCCNFVSGVLFYGWLGAVVSILLVSIYSFLLLFCASLHYKYNNVNLIAIDVCSVTHRDNGTECQDERCKC